MPSTPETKATKTIIELTKDTREKLRQVQEERRRATKRAVFSASEAIDYLIEQAQEYKDTATAGDQYPS